jgi:hypothetical protein
MSSKNESERLNDVESSLGHVRTILAQVISWLGILAPALKEIDQLREAGEKMQEAIKDAQAELDFLLGER